MLMSVVSCSRDVEAAGTDTMCPPETEYILEFLPVPGGAGRSSLG